MNPVLRIALYVVLAVSTVVLGHRFFGAYSQRLERAAQRFDEVEGGKAPATSVAAPAAAGRPAGSFLGLYAACTLGSVIALALLAAQDVSHYLAHRTHKALYNEEGEGVANPEYEQAEQVWADGDHLEAIRLMREYLRKNPREQHVALRIAEIYEKDLNNLLAAALEYEEVLEQKLEAERWGWSAIHLCNLYYRMEQTEKAETLLRRIVTEHGATAAAKKARARLGLAEGEADTSEASGAEPPLPGGLKLPPGFKPKKT